MGDPAVVIGTIVAGILGGVGVWWSKRAGAKAGVGGNQAEAIVNLQLLADTWEERCNLEHEARMRAETALADFLGARAVERELAAQCRSDLDDERSKVRQLRDQLERRRPPRGDA